MSANIRQADDDACIAAGMDNYLRCPAMLGFPTSNSSNAEGIAEVGSERSS